MLIRRVLYRLALCIALVPAAARAAESEGVSLGLETGEKYLSLSEERRAFWFAGLLDGMMAEAALMPVDLARIGVITQTPKGVPPYSIWIDYCLKRYSVDQLLAIVDKHIRAEPESWHAPAGFIARGAIIEFCKPAGLDPDSVGKLKQKGRRPK